MLKRRRPANQALHASLALRHPQGLHLLNEKGLFATGVEQGNQLNVDVLLALGRVVQVQHPLALPRLARPGQRAGLTRLVTRHIEVVRHLIAGAPHHALHRAELLAIRRIGRQNSVLGVKQNMGFGQALQVGHEFRQWLHGGSLCAVRSLCPSWQSLPNLAVMQPHRLYWQSLPVLQAFEFKEIFGQPPRGTFLEL